MSGSSPPLNQLGLPDTSTPLGFNSCTVPTVKSLASRCKVYHWNLLDPIQAIIHAISKILKCLIYLKICEIFFEMVIKVNELRLLKYDRMFSQGKKRVPLYWFACKTMSKLYLILNTTLYLGHWHTGVYFQIIMMETWNHVTRGRGKLFFHWGRKKKKHLHRASIICKILHALQDQNQDGGYKNTGSTREVWKKDSDLKTGYPVYFITSHGTLGKVLQIL